LLAISSLTAGQDLCMSVKGDLKLVFSLSMVVVVCLIVLCVLASILLAMNCLQRPAKEVPKPRPSSMDVSRPPSNTNQQGVRESVEFQGGGDITPVIDSIYDVPPKVNPVNDSIYQVPPSTKKPFNQY
jgi:hypothetical protein